MCTATRTSSYSPVEPSVFCVFSLGLCSVCSFVLFDLFICTVAVLLCFPEQLLVSGASITNLNEAPRALAACSGLGAIVP